jgi:AmmeMemoRadiSam system protein A
MTKEHSLSDFDRRELLRLARVSIERAVAGLPLPDLVLEDYSPELQQDGAAFITLTKQGRLRGCIGTLEAYQPLVQDVCEHAVAAAMSDYRFSPVTLEELPEIQIEISRLTEPQPLSFETPDELVATLRPNLDGVMLKEGSRRSTFLPQVWESLPQPEDFLAHLCKKMGVPPDRWKRSGLQVFTYQVEKFTEEEYPPERHN